MSRRCSVTKLFTFEAAHYLPNHNGKCRNLHGHSYRLEVELCGEINPAEDLTEDGMVVDFSEVSKVVKEHVISRLDHQFLNNVLPEEFLPTTAENIAYWIYEHLAVHGSLSTLLKSVTLWETETACVQVTDEDYLISQGVVG